MESERRELERVNAFSDGVFAIAITLLVLNVEIPSVPGDELGAALRSLWSDLLAYMIGFAVIGLFWFGHHRLFSRCVRSDGRLVLVNMVLLGLIGVMPFTTGLLGGYDEPIAVALYAANVGIATLVDGCLHLVARWTASRPRAPSTTRTRWCSPACAPACSSFDPARLRRLAGLAQCCGCC